MISYIQAINKLKKFHLSTNSETIFSKDSLYRICSENIYSKYNYPNSNNTALDGFAINSFETKNANNKKKLNSKY